MRILLLANNIVGLEITKFLKQENENIVGLGIHEPEKQRNTHDIIQIANVPKNNIFLAHSFREKETLEKIKNLHPDIVIAAFWGYILKKDFIAIPPQGVVNFHPGYLPYNRGMNPNVWPFIEGTTPGITIHYIDEGIDTGDIIVRKKVPLLFNDTAESVYIKTLTTIIESFKVVWPDIKKEKAERIKQSTLGKSTFHSANDIKKLDEIILDKKYTGREIINILKARSYNDRYYAYIQENGERVYLRLQVSKVYKVDDIRKNEYRDFIINKFKSIKMSQKKLRLSFGGTNKNEIGFLELICHKDIENAELIRKLALWRRKSASYFPTQFPVTLRGTKKWLSEQVIQKEDRILFLVRNDRESIIGHMGLFSFDFKERSCEIDNVVRGEIESPGIMTKALDKLLDWTRNKLNTEKIYLRVFEDNTHAVTFYKRVGFKVVSKIPLIKEIHGKTLHWTELKDKKITPQRYFLQMEYN